MFKNGSLMITNDGNVFGVVEKIYYNSFFIRYWFRSGGLIHSRIEYYKNKPTSYEHWMTVEDYVCGRTNNQS